MHLKLSREINWNGSLILVRNRFSNSRFPGVYLRKSIKHIFFITFYHFFHTIFLLVDNDQLTLTTNYLYGSGSTFSSLKTHIATLFCPQPHCSGRFCSLIDMPPFGLRIELRFFLIFLLFQSHSMFNEVACLRVDT